jgi:serine/threonine protein kinase/tetratricopeptide (TPR) repeat protein
VSRISGLKAAATKTDAVLDDLIEELTQKIQAGEPIDVEAYVRGHPDHAEMIRALVPALAVLDDLAHSTARVADTSTDPLGPGDHHGLPHGVLGDFHILRELGRGGMGVVYEAVQMSLRRAVALKVLPFAAALSPQHIARFLREAQAAAQLHHTNIVPVFAVGNERGVYYYAMQYIEGQTLAALIGELRTQAPAGPTASPHDVEPGTSLAHNLLSGRFAPEEPSPVPVTAPPPTDSVSPPVRRAGSTSNRGREFYRTVANLARQGAEALHYAHGFGILHRDIKPSNLMIDNRANLWVTDFGLARFGDDPGLSMTGDLVGTVRYMSPEQAEGRSTAVDQRTDVYALGVTLYELLTLQPAVDGHDRQQIIRRIIHHEPRPPRKLNPEIPRELETIVLKAIAKDPLSRYPTAQALGDELKRFLENKPIVAGRPNLVQRARMWMRRNPQWVSAAIVILSITVVVLAAAVILFARERAEALHQQAIASRERNVADAQRLLARRAVDEMYTEVAEKWLPYEPRMEPIRRNFLEKALQFYELLVRENRLDPAAQEEAAKAYGRIGNINSLLGHPAEAGPAFRYALAILDRLAAQFPAVSRYQHERHTTALSLARALNRIKSTGDAEAIFRRTLALCKQSAAAFPREPQFRDLLALGTFDLADLLRETARLEAAEQFYGEALALQEQLVSEFPSMPEYRRDVARTLSNRAIVYLTLGRLQNAERGFRQAADTIDQLLADSPTEPSLRNIMAKATGNLAKTLYDAGRFAEAEPPLRRAIELNTKLAADFPATPGYREDLGAQHHTQGNLLAALGRSLPAEQSFRDSLAIREKLARDHPAVPSYRMQAAACEIDFGIFLATAGRLADSESRFRAALAENRSLAAEFPNMPNYRSDVGTALNNLAVLKQQLGNHSEVCQLVAEAIGHHAAALRSSPANPEYLGQLRSDYELQAESSAALGEHVKAAEAADNAIRLLPDQWQSHFHIAAIWARAAARLETAPKQIEPQPKVLARSYADRSIAALRQARRLGFKNVKLLKEEDFNVLRQRDDFKSLARESEANK